MLTAAVLILVATVVAADYWRAIPLSETASYVGRDRCVDCHSPEMQAFSGSHHDKAMDRATEATVLGNFDDVTFQHDDVVSRFYRDGERFMINTEGADGTLQDFEIKYVFGVEPLQQYMVEFDRDPGMDQEAVGRLQVLRISWDTIHQRWFYLRPPDVAEKLLPDDPLHWTGVAQRWQTMCAACHSTDLKKNFDPQTVRYHTTFSEIDVSCEACHGPGSLHVQLANQISLFWDRHHGYGLASLKGDDAEPQLQACAPCHSRRAELNDRFLPGKQFCNHFQLETMRQETYHADGQIKDEVYVYGSFLQSKMYHMGIRCTDCHDPHSLKLKHKGNQTCTSCHQHAAGKYDVPSHHHHPVGSEGAQCVNCHMPHTTYMAIDQRRDHSLRVPRPDLSVQQNTPNACSACHVQDLVKDLDESLQQSLVGKEYADWLMMAAQGDSALQSAITQTDQWCDDACNQWYGENRSQPSHFSQVISQFRSGDAEGQEEMLRLALRPPKPTGAVSNIARASILSELAETGAPINSVPRALNQLANDPSEHPMVRAEAAKLVASSGAASSKVLLESIQDPVRQVRVTAARSIMIYGVYPSLSGTEQLQIDRILDEEVLPSLMTNSDRAGSHLTWATIQEQRGNLIQAVEAYQTAIRVEPETTGGRTNLAALLERLATSEPAEKASLMIAEAKRLRREELPLLARDAQLVPDNAMLQYRYGLSLYLDGQVDAARDSLKRAYQLEPGVETFRQGYELIEQKIRQLRPRSGGTEE